MTNANVIKLVQGDTRPQLVMALTDETTGTPINVSDPGTTVQMHFKDVDASTVKATLACGKLAGRVLADGTIDYVAPYDVPGAGGRIYLDWTADALDTAGSYQGELEVLFADGTRQTTFAMLQFYVRDQLA